MKLKWINPTYIHDHWPIVKDGIEQVRKYGDRWLSEDVYNMIKNQIANLHIGYVDDQYVGFIITQQELSFDGLVLHIWACYSNQPRTVNILEEGLPQVEEWARNIKAKRISFKSPRKGWERNNLGFKSTQTIYELEL